MQDVFEQLEGIDVEEEQGFFLLEVIVMGILLAAVSGVFLVGMRSEELRQHNENQFSAFFLVREQLSRQTAVCRARGAGQEGSPAKLEETQIRNGKAFHLSSQVKNIDGLPAMREIHIRAEWQEKEKQQQLVLRRRVWLHD